MLLALPYFESTIQKDNNNALAHFGKAMSLVMIYKNKAKPYFTNIPSQENLDAKKNIDVAIESFKKALELDPTLNQAHCEIGNTRDISSMSFDDRIYHLEQCQK